MFVCVYVSYVCNVIYVCMFCLRMSMYPMYVRTCVRMYVCMYVCMYYVCIYVLCMNVFVYARMYVVCICKCLRSRD